MTRYSMKKACHLFLLLRCDSNFLLFICVCVNYFCKSNYTCVHNIPHIYDNTKKKQTEIDIDYKTSETTKKKSNQNQCFFLSLSLCVFFYIILMIIIGD